MHRAEGLPALLPMSFSTGLPNQAGFPGRSGAGHMLASPLTQPILLSGGATGLEGPLWSALGPHSQSSGTRSHARA